MFTGGTPHDSVCCLGMQDIRIEFEDLEELTMDVRFPLAVEDTASLQTYGGGPRIG